MIFSRCKVYGFKLIGSQGLVPFADFGVLKPGGNVVCLKRRRRGQCRFIVGRFVNKSLYLGEAGADRAPRCLKRRCYFFAATNIAK